MSERRDFICRTSASRLSVKASKPEFKFQFIGSDIEFPIIERFSLKHSRACWYDILASCAVFVGFPALRLHAPPENNFADDRVVLRLAPSFECGKSTTSFSPEKRA